MKVSLEKKIDWGFALGLLILAVVSVVSYRTVTHLIESSRWVAQARELLIGLEEFDSHLKDAQRAERGYVITGDSRFLGPYQHSLPEMERLRGRLRELTAQDPPMQQRLQRLEQLTATMLAVIDEAISLRDSAGFLAAVELVKTREGKGMMDQISDHLDEMKAITKRDLIARLQANEAQARTARIVVVSGMFFALVLVVAANLLIRRDFAERKKADQALHKAYGELEAVNKELEAFTYSVSHDLRAPLRHVDGFAKLLCEEFAPQLDATAQHYLSRIQAGTRQMAQLVDDLLNLARVGRQEVRRQVTGLNSVVTEVQAELKAEAQGRQIEWRIDSLPFVDCDPTLLKQVFSNLLSNALKFSRPRTTAIIEVGQVERNGQSAVFVRDNGVGFSMKYADKLFGVFQRLHRAEDFEGTGVGLATVQRIIHKHSGQVWAEAELDKGATFYFTLGNPEGPEAKTATHTTKEVPV